MHASKGPALAHDKACDVLKERGAALEAQVGDAAPGYTGLFDGGLVNQSHVQAD